MLSEEHLSKIGGVSAITGVVVLLVATMLHPLDTHPGDAPAAFAEYALDRFWVTTHLGQLLGIVLIGTGLIALSWKLRAGAAGVWALLGAVTTVATVSLAGALQAVDGIALKFMVDRWSAASEEARAMVFEAAFGVRQIEIGLASLTSASLGLTVLLYGIALVLSTVGPTWLGVFGILGGLAALVAGVILAYAGFSDIAMATSMPSTVAVLFWTLAVGILLLRRLRLQ